MHLPRRLAASWGPGRNYTGFLPVLALEPPYGDRRRREGKAGEGLSWN
jgi:hypothetical protein